MNSTESENGCPANVGPRTGLVRVAPRRPLTPGVRPLNFPKQVNLDHESADIFD